MYAGFFVRLIAFALDNLIAACIVGVVKFPFSIARMSGVGFLNANFIFDYSFLDVFSYLGVVAYFVLLTYFSHSTPGKMLMRLEVVTVDREWTFINILYRETIGRFLSGILCIGYLAVIVTKQKQGFHDMLCDTLVVYKNMMPKETVKKENKIIQNAVAYHTTSPFDMGQDPIKEEASKPDSFENMPENEIEADSKSDNIGEENKLVDIVSLRIKEENASDESESSTEASTILSSADINE